MIRDVELTYTEQQLEVFFDTDAKFTIVTKGRRFGFTKGACNFIMESVLDGKRCLWGDTLLGNIDKYVERYMMPEIRKDNLPLIYNKNSKLLQCRESGGYTDFRSSDHPENWEGFGYDIILLNEAGIILANDYLYTNAVLPMLMDYPNSRLIAGGVPKGKNKKDGKEHKFYTLAKQAIEGRPNYKFYQFSSYDNPFLSETDVQELAEEISTLNPQMVAQEIYGEFIDESSLSPFLHSFSKEKHGKPHLIFDPDEPIYLSFDFNKSPLTCSVFQIKLGRYFHAVDKFLMHTANLPDLCDSIIAKYGTYLWNCEVTGDAMGKGHNLMSRDFANYYDLVQQRLGLSKSQIKVRSNPSHRLSRLQCNYLLQFHPSVNINPVKCPELYRDAMIVEADNENNILKSSRHKVSQQADFLDNFRYAVHTWAYKWIEQDMKIHNRYSQLND